MRYGSVTKMDFKSDIRFKGIEPEDGKVAMTLSEIISLNMKLILIRLMGLEAIFK